MSNPACPTLNNLHPKFHLPHCLCQRMVDIGTTHLFALKKKIFRRQIIEIGYNGIILKTYNFLLLISNLLPSFCQFDFLSISLNPSICRHFHCHHPKSTYDPQSTTTLTSRVSPGGEESAGCILVQGEEKGFCTGGRAIRSSENK